MSSSQVSGSRRRTGRSAPGEGEGGSGLSRRAARAGLSVSELKAERTVETAMVTANCWKNAP